MPTPELEAQARALAELEAAQQAMSSRLDALEKLAFTHHPTGEESPS